MTIRFLAPIKEHLSYKDAFPMANELTEPKSTNISDFLSKESTGAPASATSTPLTSSRRS